MKVLITGITGFLAREVAARLSKSGIEVWGTSRREDLRASSHVRGTFRFDLSSAEIDKNLVEALSGFDAVIHSAHDFTEGAGENNLRATITLAEIASRSGVKKQIFVSSYSARKDAITEYGKTKFALEEYFSGKGEDIVRPGLIVGDGGLYGRIAKFVSVSPVVFLINGGNGDVPVIGIADLSRALEKILGTKEKRASNLFHSKLVSLRVMAVEIARVLGKRRIFLPIPAGLIIAPLVIAQKLGIKTPIGVDNVRAFVHNQSTAIQSDLASLIGRESTLEEMTREALQ